MVALLKEEYLKEYVVMCPCYVGSLMCEMDNTLEIKGNLDMLPVQNRKRGTINEINNDQ